MNPLFVRHTLCSVFLAILSLGTWREVWSADGSLAPSPPPADRWAIVVGVSKYKHTPWNLDYAHRDAQQFYEQLQKPSGGAFAKDHIKLLIDQDASTENVTRALRSFLKKPSENDVVLLYFSCHGSQDPERAGRVYLLTHDTDPTDIAGTAVPMREIQLCIQEYLRAKRVVILADTCHSAAVIGAGNKDVAQVSTTPVNDYLTQVSHSSEGVAWLTSAQANELSLENARWGGGHGVFTHFVLKGMQGEADKSPVDGIVTFAELAEYVRAQVKEETGSKQTPVIGPTPFDPRFPMGITGEANAHQHFELGTYLYELGWAQLDRRFFLSAANTHFSEAERFFAAGKQEERLAQARRMRGLALIAAGEYQQAIRPLMMAADATAAKLHDCHYYLGICHAKAGKFDEAAASVNRFVTLAPKDANVLFAQGLLGSWATSRDGGQKYAILIGVGHFADKNFQFPLQGTTKDVSSMRNSLTQSLGIADGNITSLVDASATKEAILASIDNLSKTLKPRDTALIYYSGHSSRDTSPSEWFFIPYDVKMADSKHNNMANRLSCKELASHLQKLSCSKVVLLDTMPPQDEKQLKPFVDADCTVIVGCQFGGMSMDTGQGGAFTVAFSKALESMPATITYGGLIDLVGFGMPSAQRPFLVGNRYQRAFSHLGLFDLFDHSLKPEYKSLSDSELIAMYDKGSGTSAGTTAAFHWRFGEVLLDRKLFSKAHDAFSESKRRNADPTPSLLLHLAQTQLRTGRYEECVRTIQRLPTASQLPSQAIASAGQLAQRSSRRHALLVGIDDYKSLDADKVFLPRGAVNDARTFKRLLIERFKFQESNVTMLTNADATREAIVNAFDSLVRKSLEEPAFFFFAGLGSIDSVSDESIVATDSRDITVHNRQDILLKTLADRTKELAQGRETNLTCVIDAGIAGRRFIASESSRLETKSRNVELVPLSNGTTRNNYPQIGRHTIYLDLHNQAARTNQTFDSEFDVDLGEPNHIHEVRGRLSHATAQSLDTAGDSISYRELQSRVSAIFAASESGNYDAKLLSAYPSELVFSNAVAEGQVDASLTEASRNNSRRAAAILGSFASSRPDLAVDVYLDLGMTYQAIGEFTKAVDFFNEAVTRSAEKNGYLLPECRYRLGSALYHQADDLDRAVSELRKAAELAPNDPRPQYFLGLAIHRLVERDLLAEARKHLQAYLDAGSPLGDREGVKAVLMRQRVDTIER